MRDFLSNRKLSFISPTPCCVWKKWNRNKTEWKQRNSKPTSTKKKKASGGEITNTQCGHKFQD
jgi:hypothetical protein